ncbi:MAG: tRNA (N6-threonylcarbamoyladenosine(37)-N6)-methyltransferase TrmO [Anaerolineae bacterium]|jgi:tRNA-Thr(GGU) m(6)t(6)A37 methyltransferase TsaA
MDFTFESIGQIRTSFQHRSRTPIQPCRSEATGQVELFPEYEAGLRDVEGFSHLILVYVFHRADPGFDLLVTPFLDDQPKGLFATRYPRRPNSIGLSVVELLRCQGRVLHVQGIDVLDGTPLLDIKPYVPPFDARPDASMGWLAGRV